MKNSAEPDATPSALEVGVWKGAWLLQLVGAHPSATGLGVDPYPGSPTLAQQVRDRSASRGLAERIDLVPTTADACALRCDGTAPHHQYSVIHIDGLHDEQHVADELRYATDHCGPTGTVIVDDYLHPAYPGVAAAMYQFLSREQLAMFLVTPNKAYLCPSDAHAIVQTGITEALDEAALGWEMHKGERGGARYVQKPDVMGFPVALCLAPGNNSVVLDGLDKPRNVLLREFKERWIPPGIRDLLRPIKQRVMG